jgi:ribosome-associated protein
MKKISINTEFIKLDQFLKWSGAAENGAEGKEMVLEGIVKVNGFVEMQRGKKLHKGDKIEIKGINEIFVVD